MAVISKIIKSLRQRLLDEFSPDVTADKFFLTVKEMQNDLQHKGKVPRIALGLNEDSNVPDAVFGKFDNLLSLRLVYSFATEKAVDSVERIEEISDAVDKLKKAVQGTDNNSYLVSTVAQNGISKVSSISLVAEAKSAEIKRQHIDCTISISYLTTYMN